MCKGLRVVERYKNLEVVRVLVLLVVCPGFFFESDVRVKISAPTKVVDIPVTLLGYGAYELQCFGENCLS